MEGSSGQELQEGASPCHCCHLLLLSTWKEGVIIASTAFAVLESLALVYSDLTIFWSKPYSNTNLVFLAVTILFLAADVYRIYLLGRWVADTPPHTDDISNVYEVTRKCMAGSLISVLILFPISLFILDVTFFSSLLGNHPPRWPSLIIFCTLVIMDLYIFLPLFLLPWAGGLAWYWNRVGPQLQLDEVYVL